MCGLVLWFNSNIVIIGKRSKHLPNITQPIEKTYSLLYLAVQPSTQPLCVFRMELI
jgi:hypothetical protein